MICQKNASNMPITWAIPWQISKGKETRKGWVFCKTTSYGVLTQLLECRRQYFAVTCCDPKYNLEQKIRYKLWLMAFQFNLEKRGVCTFAINWVTFMLTSGNQIGGGIGVTFANFWPLSQSFLCFFSMDSLKHLHSPSYLYKEAGFLVVKSP